MVSVISNPTSVHTKSSSFFVVCLLWLWLSLFSKCTYVIAILSRSLCSLRAVSSCPTLQWKQSSSLIKKSSLLLNVFA